MFKLRIFLCACFGNLALVFVMVSVMSVPRLIHPFPAGHGLSRTPGALSSDEPSSIFIIAVLGILAILPPIVAFLNGMAWWTVKKGKASARGWAIAASLSLVLSSIPIFFPLIGAWTYVPIGFLMGLLLISVSILSVGITGVVAFARRDATAQTPIEPAKPPRIVGDGTSGLLDGIAWLLGIAGYFGGMSWWHRWGQAHHLSSTHGYRSWLQILAALLIVTILHESSHAAAGLALGMKLRAFIVGPFQWGIRDGRWRFQFLPAKFLSLGGAAALVPADLRQSRWREVCMIALGRWLIFALA